MAEQASSDCESDMVTEPVHKQVCKDHKNENIEKLEENDDVMSLTEAIASPK